MWFATIFDSIKVAFTVTIAIAGASPGGRCGKAQGQDAQNRKQAKHWISPRQLKSWIGRGYVRGGVAEWEGKTIMAESPVDVQSCEVTVVSPHFFDPDGGRMHG